MVSCSKTLEVTSRHTVFLISCWNKIVTVDLTFTWGEVEHWYLNAYDSSLRMLISEINKNVRCLL